MSYDWINHSSHFGGEGNCIRRLLHLALRTWVSGLGSLVADGHGLCGRFHHRKSLWPVLPQKTLAERRWTDGRTDATSDFIYMIVTTPLWPSVGVKPNTPKVGDLESSGTPECLELDNKVQKTLHWSVIGVIEKVLKRKCPKWPRIGHLDTCSPSYGQKKGRESKWQFDSRPLKVRNRPLPDIRFEKATRRWKDLDKGYNFGSKRIAIGLWNRELWAPKVPGLQPGQFQDSFRTISGLQLGSPGKMCHLDVASVTSCREYYMGEGGGFPRVRAVVSQVSPRLPVVCPNTQRVKNEF
jgi:hypothetical protein